MGISIKHAGIETDTCEIGDDTELYEPANIYKCKIGSRCRVGPFVEIQAGTVIGDGVTIGSHSVIAGGTIIEDDVFLGRYSTITNTRWPDARNSGDPTKWVNEPSRICKGATLGSHTAIGPGLTIGAGSFIGLGSTVIRDVPPGEIWAGNPARKIGSKE